MQHNGMVEFSVITPSAGKRPNALERAVRSVEDAWEFARKAAAERGVSLDTTSVEMLVGFDGVKGIRPEYQPDFLRCFDLPLDNDWGNGIRPILLKAARGRRVLFLDDDNLLTPEAFDICLRNPDADLIVARIDTGKSFEDKPWLPFDEPGKSLIRQGNVDPLCICATRELVVVRCNNWQFSGYPADYQNIIRFYRRSQNTVVTDEVIGIYDAGRGLDDHKTGRRSLPHEVEKRF